MNEIHFCTVIKQAQQITNSLRAKFAGTEVEGELETLSKLITRLKEPSAKDPPINFKQALELLIMLIELCRLLLNK